MSFPSLPLILSPQAEDDFADILRHTHAAWGEAQMLAYRAVLDKALLAIGENPRIGQSCPELSAYHRIFPAGRHIVVYHAANNAVNVSRILHGRMDIKRHL